MFVETYIYNSITATPYFSVFIGKINGYELILLKLVWIRIFKIGGKLPKNQHY